MPSNLLTAKCLRYIILTAIILLLDETKRANFMKFYYVAIEENLYGSKRYGVGIYAKGNLIKHIPDVFCEKTDACRLCERLTENELDPEQIYDAIEDFLCELYDL